MATIANMTIEELKQFINDLLEERRLEHLFGEFELADSDLEVDETPDTRTLEEVFQSIDDNMWTPPPGTPSPAQMIREDRDR